MSLCISSKGEFSSHEFGTVESGRGRFICAACGEVGVDLLFAALENTEAQASRFAQRLADSARDSNNAISSLSRRATTLALWLDGIVHTLERGERVTHETITGARALLTPVSGNEGE